MHMPFGHTAHAGHAEGILSTVISVDAVRTTE